MHGINPRLKGLCCVRSIQVMTARLYNHAANSSKIRIWYRTQAQKLEQPEVQLLRLECQTSPKKHETRFPSLLANVKNKLGLVVIRLLLLLLLTIISLLLLVSLILDISHSENCYEWLENQTEKPAPSFLLFWFECLLQNIGTSTQGLPETTSTSLLLVRTAPSDITKNESRNQNKENLWLQRRFRPQQKTDTFTPTPPTGMDRPRPKSAICYVATHLSVNFTGAHYLLTAAIVSKPSLSWQTK